MKPTDAVNLALRLMEEHGLIEDGWTFEWSRGKRQFGVAQVRKKRDPRTGELVEVKTIKLSRPLVEINDEGEVRDTILHEIAHAIAGVEHGHDATWKTVCRRIGAKPDRTYNDTQVNTVKARYEIVCTCCDRVVATRFRRTDNARLSRMGCRHCGRPSLGKLTIRATDQSG